MQLPHRRHFLSIMQMKRTILSLMLLMPIVMMAQNSIATVNRQAVFDAMPAAVEATKTLAERNERYRNEYATLQADFNKNFAAYQRLNADAATPPSILERRLKEIQSDNAKIDSFLEDCRKDIEGFKQQLEQPIYDEVDEAIAAVAREMNLTYVFDVSVTPLAYRAPEAVDITDAVKRKLGLR